MDYTEIKTVALSYADRTDQEVLDRMDDFLRIVESRINRKLKVSKMSIRSVIDLTLADTDQEYFALPSDFGGLRDIEIQTDSARKTMKYINPEQMNNRVTAGNLSNAGRQIYYTIVAQQLQVYPPTNEGNLEIIYYQRLVPLSDSDTTNWMSNDNPDCYIFGLLVEISSFAKDAETATLWDTRFSSTIDEIDTDDAETRWSGPSLETKVG
jgi:hypothetical protein